MGSFQGDLLYALIGCGIAIIVGFALIMKAGSKFGWLIVAGGVAFAFYALQPTMRKAGSSGAAPGASGTSGSYYDVNKNK
jgi:hypothetical protein